MIYILSPSWQKSQSVHMLSNLSCKLMAMIFKQRHRTEKKLYHGEKSRASVAVNGLEMSAIFLQSVAVEHAYDK